MKWSDLLLPSPKYATHNLYKKWEGTMSPGILYPIWHRLMLPGDKFKLNLRHLFRTNPTKAPLFSSFKVRIVTVVANLKNYAIALEGYRRSFDWRTTVLPHFHWRFPSGVNWTQSYTPAMLPRMGVKETSLADYLGYPRGWIPTYQQYRTETSGGLVSVDKSAIPFLVYYDFYRNYMVNPQVDSFPMFCPNKAVTGQEGKSYVKDVKLSYLDDFFEDVHKYYDGSNGAAINTDALANAFNLALSYNSYDPSVYASNPEYKHPWSCNHGGLVATLYDPDMNTQWMSSANFEKMLEARISTQTVNSVSGDLSFTSFGDIVKASSIWQFMMGEVYGDGTYANHIYSQYGVSVKADMNIPQIVHVTDSILSFDDITSQSDTVQGAGTDNETGSPVGQQFGVGRSAGATPNFTIHNSDKNIAMAMTFCWITPQVRYASGIHPDTNIKNLSDIYVPAFDNYSLQPLLQEQIQAQPVADGDYMGVDAGTANLSFTGALAHAVVGYQPAFTEYKSDYSTVHGLLKSSLSYWTIVRNFPVIAGVTTSGFINGGYVYDASIGNYIPEKDAITYNVPFSIENEDNIQAQFVFDVTAIRPISKSVLPNVR